MANQRRNFEVKELMDENKHWYIPVSKLSCMRTVRNRSLEIIDRRYMRQIRPRLKVIYAIELLSMIQ